MTDRIKALSTNLEPGIEDDKEFERRAKTAELVLKEMQMKASQGVTNANTNRNAEITGSNQQQVRLPQQPNRPDGGEAQALRQAFSQAQNQGQ
jgi:hypothetical protein